MADIDNNTIALLNELDYSEVQSDKREFKRPPDGTHMQELQDYIVESNEKTLCFGQPGFTAVPVWKFLPDPDAPLGEDKPYVFYGEKLRLPTAQANLSQLTEGQLKNIEINKAKLATHIRVILDRAPSNALGQDLMALTKAPKEAKIVVKASCKTTPSTKKDKNGNLYPPNFSERLIELVSN